MYALQKLLTIFFRLTLHLQVHGGEAEFVALGGGQLLLLDRVAGAQPFTHSCHLLVKLLPGDFVVEAQPAELDLHT